MSLNGLSIMPNHPDAVAEFQRLLGEMRADDSALVRAIVDAPDGATTVDRIHTYYRDFDRAERTPRGILYMHLGLLVGVYDRLRSAAVNKGGE